MGFNFPYIRKASECVKLLDDFQIIACGSHFVFPNKAKNIPRQVVTMNMSRKFEKSTYKSLRIS